MTLSWKFDDFCKGNAVTFNYLLESLVYVDADCLPNAKKRRKKCGEGMQEDHERYTYGDSNRAILLKPCMMGTLLSAMNNQGQASNFERTTVSLG
jgi:hypothetical protein